MAKENKKVEGVDAAAEARKRTANALQTLYNMAIAVSQAQKRDADNCVDYLAVALGLSEPAKPEVVPEKEESNG